MVVWLYVGFTVFILAMLAIDLFVVGGGKEHRVSFREAAQRMPGEVIACLADRKRQFECYRDDLAATQFAEVEVDVETGVIRAMTAGTTTLTVRY